MDEEKKKERREAKLKAKELKRGRLPNINTFTGIATFGDGSKYRMNQSWRKIGERNDR